MSFFSHNYVKYLTEPCHNDIILLVDVSWCLQPWYKLSHKFVPAQEVLQGCSSNYSPQNLKQEHNFSLVIPVSEELQLLLLDFGQWQCDANVLLLMPGHDSYGCGSLVGNSFRPTEEEAHLMGTSSLHKKRF
jgi:hypothetical protein